MKILSLCGHPLCSSVQCIPNIIHNTPNTLSPTDKDRKIQATLNDVISTLRISAEQVLCSKFYEKQLQSLGSFKFYSTVVCMIHPSTHAIVYVSKFQE